MGWFFQHLRARGPERRRALLRSTPTSAPVALMRQPATEKRHAPSLEMDILLASKNALWSKIVA